MKATQILSAIIAIVCGLCSLNAAAQRCNDKIPASTPTARFHDNRDGSVTDIATGLRWSRCSLGQHWEQGRCQGEAQALPYAIAALVAEKDWRLPTIVELSSLVELRCAQPAINTDIFPDTMADIYWTSTRFANQDGKFWQVHFLHGEGLPEKADSTAYVRLLRDE
jgi:hypothetical protein